MPSITIESGGLSSFFLVPRAVEEHLTVASHAELKVFIALLACEGQTLADDIFAEKAGLKKEELADAIKYWITAGIFVKRGGALRLAVGAGVGKDKMPDYAPETIASRADKDKALGELLRHAEQILGKLLSPSDISSLFGMYDWLGLPADVVMMLLEHCRQNGTAGMRYIEKCAVSWADEGIDTFEKAEHKLRAIEERRQTENRVAALFGIGGRALSKKESDYITRWTQDMRMNLELIGAAYEETVNNTGKLSFPYINKILQSWEGQGVKTAAAAETLPRPKAKGRQKPAADTESAYGDEDFLKPTWELLE